MSAVGCGKEKLTTNTETRGTKESVLLGRLAETWEMNHLFFIDYIF